MKNVFYLKLLSIASITIGLSFLAIRPASASVLYLDPAKGTSHQGDILPLRIYLDTQGEQITNVSANLSYSKDKFDVAWIDGGLSAFSFQIEQTIDTDKALIKISRNNITPVNGKVPLIDFGLVTKNTGSGLAAFSSGSQALRASDNADTLSLGGSRGGSFVITSQPVSGDHNTPQISNIAISDIGPTSFTASWQTDEPSTSEVTYGFTENQYIYQVASADLSTTHKITVANSPNHPLVHGALLHFRLKSKDKSGNLATSNDKTVHLIGIPIRLHVVDKKSGSGIPDAVVSLKDELSQVISEETTDKEGYAKFNNVSVGKQQAYLDDPDKYSQINITDDSANKTFQVSFNYSFQFFPSSLIIIVTVFGVLAVLVASILLIKRPFRQPTQFPPSPFPPQEPGNT